MTATGDSAEGQAKVDRVGPQRVIPGGREGRAEAGQDAGRLSDHASTLVEVDERADRAEGRSKPCGDAEFRGRDRLMPMHLCVDANGRIVHLGPTAATILRGSDPLGRSFWEVFTPTRPPPTLSLRDLADRQAVVHLRLRDHEATQLRGVVVHSGATEGQGGASAAGVIVNLSFGIDLAAAVRRHGLTAGDFAPTDLAMELLYLQEAKSAVLQELLALSQRLDEARRDAERQALSDPLTGLANRRACEAALQAAADGLSGGEGFAVAHIDLDHFKQVNDSHGHAAGDQVLTHVSAMLAAGVRRHDVVARVGGDEFVLLLRGLNDAPALRDFGDRMIARIEQPFEVVPRPGADPVTVAISASIGVVTAVAGTRSTPDRLMCIADAALYAAKRRGRGRCLVRSSTGVRLPSATLAGEGMASREGLS